jgi:hypothetical protein
MSQFLAHWEEYAQSVTDAPIDFLHSAGLIALSGISLGRRWLDRGADGIHPAVYIMLLAGSSRDRKSYCVDKLAMKILRKVETKRVGPEDFSPEGLVTSYLPHDGIKRNKKVIPQPEFGKYLARSKQQYGASTSAVLCQLYDGATFDYQRSGKPPLTIKAPLTSLFGGVAYGMLVQHGNPMDWVSGFYARMLWVIPRERRPKFDPPPPANPEGFERCVEALFDLKTRLKASRRALGLSKDAESHYIEFAKTIPDDLTDPALAASRERLMDATLRLSIIYQVDLDHNQDIGIAAMARACEFASRAWEATKVAYRESDGSELDRDTVRIWRYLTEQPGMMMARRDLYRSLSMRVGAFNAASESLIKMGVLIKAPVPTGSDTGKSKSIAGFRVVEAYQERDARMAAY